MSVASPSSLYEGEWDKTSIFARRKSSIQSYSIPDQDKRSSGIDAQYISKMEYLELENSELLRENDELIEHIRARDAEMDILRREYKHSLEYIEDLHSKLMENIQSMALQKMEIEKFKVERLVFLDEGTNRSPKEEDPVDQEISVVDAVVMEPSLKRIEEFRRKSTQILEPKAPSRVHRKPEQQETQRSLMTGSDGVAMMSKEMRMLRAAIIAKEKEIRFLNAELKKYKEKRRREDREIRTGLDESPHSRRDSQSTTSTELKRRDELIHEVHAQMEEKVRWQSYAEKLLRLIIHRSPELLHVQELSSSKPAVSVAESGDELLEARWEDFAFSILQKVIRQAPQVITEDDFCVFEKLTEDQQRVKTAFQNQFTISEGHQISLIEAQNVTSPAVPAKTRKKWFHCHRKKKKNDLTTPPVSKSMENINVRSSDVLVNSSSQLSFV